MRLTDTQHEFFRQNGYLVLERFLDEQDLGPIVAFLNAEVTRRAGELVARGQLSRTWEELGFEHQLARISQETETLVQDLWHEGVIDQSLLSVIRSPRLLSLAEQLCGSEELLAANGYWVRPKVPRHPMFQFPWHQDAGYMSPVCEQVMIPVVWMGLVDCTPERGCLWVRPYRHAEGRCLPHVRSRVHPTIRILEHEMAHLPPVCVPIPRGGAVLMHNLTPHASYENTSDVVRWSFDVRYQRASAPSNAHFTRLAGDAPPGPDPARAGCLPPEFDFLVQSRLRPDEVVADAEAYRRLRSGFVPGERDVRWPPEPA